MANNTSITALLETIPEEMQKEVYEELKGKYEQKPPKAHNSIIAFAKKKNEEALAKRKTAEVTSNPIISNHR
jgi:spore germination protein GerM